MVRMRVKCAKKYGKILVPNLFGDIFFNLLCDDLLDFLCVLFKQAT